MIVMANMTESKAKKATNAGVAAFGPRFATWSPLQPSNNLSLERNIAFACYWIRKSHTLVEI